MERKRSGPMTSTTWPIAVSSCTTVISVRTTPLTCGCHASLMIRIRCDSAADSRTSGAMISKADTTIPLAAGASFRRRRSRHRDKAPILGRNNRRSGNLSNACCSGAEERQPVLCCPIDQFQPPVVVFDQGRAAFDPIAAVEVEDTVDITNLGMVDMAADDAVET